MGYKWGLFNHISFNYNANIAIYRNLSKFAINIEYI